MPSVSPAGGAQHFRSGNPVPSHAAYPTGLMAAMVRRWWGTLGAMSTDSEISITGVVVGFDGSPSSLLALEWAADAAVAYGRPLTLLRARPDAEGEVTEVDADEAAQLLGEEQAELLEDAAQRIVASRPGLDVHVVVHPDSPVEALLDASRSADLIVLGSRGTEGFRGLLLGSTVMNVAPLSGCPVVVLYVPDEDADIARANARHPADVVVGYDGSESAGLALGFGLRHAAATGRGVAVVVVAKGRASVAPAVQVSSGGQGLPDHIRQLLRAASEVADSHPGVPVTYWYGVGRPAGVLIAEGSGSPLAVVGARGVGGLAGLLLGSVGLQMLMHAECPVALVHPSSA